MSPPSGLRLLLPGIVPSWRFFDAVTASPRVDFTLGVACDEMVESWQEFRPRPAVLTFGVMMRRLLWNAQWNENLFLVSLAERLMRAETEATVIHSERELLLRVARHLDIRGAVNVDSWLQIRLRFLRRPGPTDAVIGEIVYLSSPYPVAELLIR